MSLKLEGIEKKVVLEDGETYGLPFCPECGDYCVCPLGADESWLDDWFDGDTVWPENSQGECECGYVGPVKLDIIQANHFHYATLRTVSI